MDEQSQNDTEPTPEPSPIGPPPPQLQQRQRQRQPQHVHSSPLTTNSKSQQTESLLEQALFSVSAHGNIYEDNDDDESLPSLAIVPPSPLSRPSPSLFDDTSEPPWRQQEQQPPRRYNHRTPERPYRSRQPPVPEVLLNNDEDTFFEDRSLRHQTQRSLENTPEAKLGSLLSARSRLPSALPGMAEPKQQPLEQQDRDPSSEDVARVHENALQALIRLKEELLKAKEKIHLLDQQKAAVMLERDSLKRLVETRESRATALQVDLSELQETVNNLRSQNEDLDEAKKGLEAKLRAVTREKKELTHKRIAAENRQKDMKVQLDLTHCELETMKSEKSDLAAILVDMKEELERRTKESSELSARIQNLAENEAKVSQLKVETDVDYQLLEKEYEIKREEIERLESSLNTSVELLKEDNETKRLEIERLQKEFDRSKDELKSVSKSKQANIERLEAALKESNEAIQQLRTTLSSRTRPSLRNSPGSIGLKRSSTTNVNESTNTESSQLHSGNVLDTSITERLSRIRDSTERASLVRAHRRELTRLKTENESSIKKLTMKNEEAMYKALKQAEAKMNSRLEELKFSLQREHEEQLEDVETRYRQKVKEIQEELERKTESSEESFRVAMAKVTTSLQQYEREKARREAIERSVEELNIQLEEEKKQLMIRHKAEIERLRSDWEEERSTLLSIIQKECNSVFERRRKQIMAVTNQTNFNTESSSSTVIPRTFFPNKELTVDTVSPAAPSPRRAQSIHSTRRTTSAALISPTFSDIDSVLRETEELVESLM